jgi:hypothetical protein
LASESLCELGDDPWVGQHDLGPDAVDDLDNAADRGRRGMTGVGKRKEAREWWVGAGE